MECKYYDLKGSLAAAERINRYIMECKLICGQNCIKKRF